MLAVSNTSPVSNLAIIGRLEFLQRRYGLVRIPPAVQNELAALTHPNGFKSIQAALSDHWLVVEPLTTVRHLGTGLTIWIKLQPTV
jgi:hypothetical protein